MSKSILSRSSILSSSVQSASNDEELYFSTYKPRESCSSVEEYNLQPAEIDAHAFAGIIIEDFFGARPLFKNLSDTVRLKVFARMDRLSSLYLG